jgi:hypothetical protein
MVRVTSEGQLSSLFEGLDEEGVGAEAVVTPLPLMLERVNAVDAVILMLLLWIVENLAEDEAAVFKVVGTFVKEAEDEEATDWTLEGAEPAPPPTLTV